MLQSQTNFQFFVSFAYYWMNVRVFLYNRIISWNAVLNIELIIQTTLGAQKIYIILIETELRISRVFRDLIIISGKILWKNENYRIKTHSALNAWNI